MFLILTMAGLYSRFAEQGYRFPKYLLPWGGKTVLAKILAEMSRGGHFHDVFLIGNLRDEAYAPHIRSILRAHHLSPDRLHFIEDTRGQAETAFRGLDYVEKTAGLHRMPVVFHNIDTILFERNYGTIESALAENSGFVDVFRSSNHNYSYVLLDSNKNIAEIVEKTIISDIATSGLYGFASGSAFCEGYDPKSDIYITSVYRRLLDQKLKIASGEIHNETDTVVLGTPSEYLNASLTVNPVRLS